MLPGGRDSATPNGLEQFEVRIRPVAMEEFQRFGIWILNAEAMERALPPEEPTSVPSMSSCASERTRLMCACLGCAQCVLSVHA